MSAQRQYISTRTTNNKRRSDSSRISKTSKRSINNTKYSRNKQSPHSRSRGSKIKHRSKYQGKSSISRRKQRDINYQYKLYSLREIIEKITTKSSIISTNTAKETLITYYQTFTTAQELMDELEHRFFSVLPAEEEDKETRPYISDTDSISERHFKYKFDGNNTEMNENKAYCIQVRVINLLTFWMKEYFMEDFEENNMIQRLKQFIERIKTLKTKQKLPSIPYDDMDENEIPVIPDNNNINNNNNGIIYNDGVSPIRPLPTNHQKIRSYHDKKQHQNVGFTVNKNPLHPQHTPIIHSPSNPQITGIIADANSQNSATMRTEQMEHIATKISPIPTPAINPIISEEDHLALDPSYFYVDQQQKQKQRQIEMDSIFILNPSNNTVYISPKQLCHLYENIKNNNDYNMNPCIIINGFDNNNQHQIHKVMIRNISDYNDMHYYEQYEYPIPPNISNKHIPPKPVKSALFVAGHSKTSKTSEETERKEDEQNKEVTDNIVSTPMTSSEDLRDTSPTTFKNEHSRISMDDAMDIKNVDNKENNNDGNDNNNNNNNNNNNDNSPHFYNHSNGSRRYYVRDPSKYKQLADKIEKVLYKQKREAPRSTKFIQNRRQSTKNILISSRDKSVSIMSVPGHSITGGSKIMSDLFHSEILPLKEDFQNKVKNEDIAEQITLMTYKAFKRVRKREFIDQAWKCKDRLELAGNLCQLIDHFNCISRWVQITILHCENVKKRGRMIKKFIKIMDKLLELNNFQSLCAVYGAITSSSIYSLESAWLYVPDKHKHRFEEIKHYFVTANNMQNLRSLHKERNPPMIPYTGIYLQDLIQTEERFKERMLREQIKSTNNNNNNNINNNYFNYDFSGSGKVVFDHLTKMSKQIDSILIYAKTPYDNITDDHIIQKYILSEFEDQAKLSDDDIYKIAENVSKADG